MRAFMGFPNGHERLQTRFIYLDDESDEPIIEDGFLTWLRPKAEISPLAGLSRDSIFQRPKYRRVPLRAIFLSSHKRRDGGLLVVIAEGGSSAASQLEWLFGFSQDLFPRFSVRAELENGTGQNSALLPLSSLKASVLKLRAQRGSVSLRPHAGEVRRKSFRKTGEFFGICSPERFLTSICARRSGWRAHGVDGTRGDSFPDT